jgi:hypothetical protein
MSEQPETILGRDRLDLISDLTEHVQTVRELHWLAREVNGAHSHLERQAWQTIAFLDALAADVRRATT